MRSNDPRAPVGGDREMRQPNRQPTGVDTQPSAVMNYARRFVGLRYLWGGVSPWGFDCSGLVHFSYRMAGVVVPRDASAQHAASIPVPLGDEEPGDLYFFANDDGRVTHVGFVAYDEKMLHAPEGGGLIEEAPLSPERHRSLIGAGRLITV